jgi:drug/metabolite transporter (DMT)-like permease
MLIVFVSVLIFGLVHPVSKLLLDQGIPLSYFCILYVGIRFIFQLPVFLKKRDANLQNRKIFYLLLLVGLVGAFLQLFEFKGIHQGLQPAMVTFLMFSYPAWILVINLFGKSQTFSAIEAAQSMAVVAGIFFLSQANFSSFEVLSSALAYPLLASVFIAAWIVLSNRLRKEGVGSFELSAYYDLFSIVALLIIFSGSLTREWPQFLTWSQSADHIFGMTLYSLLIGLLPNLMFYFGSRKVSSHLAGTMMAFEPLFSALYSAMIWNTMFGGHFILGGILILFANIPKEIFINTFRREVAYEK